MPKFEKSEIKESLNNAANILANSKATAKKIEMAYGARNINVLYPGCLVASKIPEKRENFYLVVHMVSLSKNFQILYELLKRNRDINIVIAGAKKYLWQAVYIKFKIMFGSRVNFVLDPTDEELSTLYMRSKMLLHTAIENFGMSPLEAGGYGTPSIAVRGSGVVEVLEEDKEIFCFDEDNIEELDSLIRQLSHDSGKLVDAGQRALQKAKKFDWNAHGKLLINKIKEIH
jgi:glycosyltransferase involved in cell wall biosynthesis